MPFNHYDTGYKLLMCPKTAMKRYANNEIPHTPELDKQFNEHRLNVTLFFFGTSLILLYVAYLFLIALLQAKEIADIVINAAGLLFFAYCGIVLSKDALHRYLQRPFNFRSWLEYWVNRDDDLLNHFIERGWVHLHTLDGEKIVVTDPRQQP